MSHVPFIAFNVNKQPYGLNKDPVDSILQKYYEIMIDSKDEKAYNFLINILRIKNEIKDLYL